MLSKKQQRMILTAIMNSNIQDYIDLVRSGTIPVCQEQLQLCDLVEKVFRNEYLFIDEPQLEKYLSYQKYFPFDLLKWEKFLFALHNCVYKSDGRLRWPDPIVIVGRGTGKNGYEGFEDFCLLTPTHGVMHYDIDIFATSEDQAKVSFDDVWNVLEANKKLMIHNFTWNKEVIISKKTLSKFTYNTSSYKTKDGFRPGKVTHDEEHAYENSKLISVPTTGLGKVKNPRHNILSSMGDVRGGPLDDDFDVCQQILRGEIPDNGILPFICRVESNEEILNPDMWVKANPSLPWFPDLKDRMIRELEEYKRDPIHHADFATRRLNRPQGNKEHEVTSWDNILATKRELPELKKKTAVFGLDYAMLNDFASIILDFEIDGINTSIQHTWICSQSADLYRIKYPYLEDVEREEVTMVDEAQINPEILADYLIKMKKEYNIIYGAMDSFRFALVETALKRAGFFAEKKENGKVTGNLKLIRPSDIMQIAPIINSDFIDHRINWGNSRIMRWYTNNTKRIVDGKGNYTYGKIESKSRKTDGFMAYVAARCVSSKIKVMQKRKSIDLDVHVY